MGGSVRAIAKEEGSLEVTQKETVEEETRAKRRKPYGIQPVAKFGDRDGKDRNHTMLKSISIYVFAHIV